MDALRISSSFDSSADFVLFQGDCRRLLSQIPSGTVKLVVSSPPYNLGKPYEERLGLDAYLAQQRETIAECVRVLHPKGSLCWQIGTFVDAGQVLPLDLLLFPMFKEFPLRLRNRIVWHFGHGLHARRRFSGRYEVILWLTKSDDYEFNVDPIRVPQKYPSKRHYTGNKKGQLSCNPRGKNPGDVWEIPNVKANHVEKTIHPCQFPVALVERLVLSMTTSGDWVLDPYMGAGSTAIAALMHGRKAAGAEIHPDYVNATMDRVRLAREGRLRIRPLDAPIADPSSGRKGPSPAPVLFPRHAEGIDVPG